VAWRMLVMGIHHRELAKIEHADRNWLNAEHSEVDHGKWRRNVCIYAKVSGKQEHSGATQLHDAYVVPFSLPWHWQVECPHEGHLPSYSIYTVSILCVFGFIFSLIAFTLVSRENGIPAPNLRWHHRHSQWCLWLYCRTCPHGF
jgi:hypothetical protein